MIASGFAALAYQIVWTQQSTLWLGHEAAAVLAVVAAFFGGVAFGALAFSAKLERSAHPARWYAVCEIAIGIWSLLLALLLAPVSSAVLTIIGPNPSALWHWSSVFGSAFILLLPATAAMGATLPAMERVLGTFATRSSIGILYTANTFGAVLGVVAAAFWLVPQFGLLRTAILCAGLNFACAVATLRLPQTRNSTARSPPTSSYRLLSTLAATGALGIGYEVIAVRVLSQVTENTVYTFAILLAIYLVGTTFGAAAYTRWASTLEASRARDRLFQLVAVACLIGGFSMVKAEDVQRTIIETFGSSVRAALAAEGVLAIAVFMLPTLAMGALFSHLCTDARFRGIAFSHALGFNTLGAASAPILFGVLIVPWLGLAGALAIIAIGYLGFVGWAAWRTAPQWAALVALGSAIAWHPSLSTIDIPEGGRIVRHIEGPTAVVSIVEDALGVATLHINNRQQEGSSATVLADSRQALLPVLLHPAPERALFLGVGTGITARGATLDPRLNVDAVELIPEVLEASAHFTRAFPSTPRLTMKVADARRFVRTSARQYDLIVSDNFHPARSGSGSLYTIEHFSFVRDRLTNDGVFCQWLPLHQLDLETLRIIVRSFLHVHPRASAMLATLSLDTPVIGLIARRDGERFDLHELRQRLHELAAPADLASFGLVDELSLLGGFIAGPDSLHRFAQEGPLNTDDRPVVAYTAPRMTYAPSSAPRERLVELLNRLEIEPDDVLATDASHSIPSQQLAAYWSARNRFIEIGTRVRPTLDVRNMLAQVRDPLLSVLRTSPDFRPAYDPLLKMAGALAELDADAARALLHELNEAQPERPQALDLLRALQDEHASARVSFAPSAG